MSGGVDSSVAAYLLKKQGYDVVGVFMRCYNIDGCAERDAEDARRVAEKLKIPFYVFDFEGEYKRKVVEYMIDGYREGITPNPDVMCNREIKFGLFLKKALEMGADYVATGHYVRLQKSQIPNLKSQINPKSQNQKPLITHYSLLIAKDSNKDQSYFLWTLTQEQLKHCLFPIGDYLKSEVRVIAKKAGLPTADKKDSQGICFLGKISLDEFLKQYIPEKPGAVLTTEGQKIGEHPGAHFYTIGQRHLGISNIKNQKSNSAPVYVTEKDVKTNTLIVVEGEGNPVLYKTEIELENVNFISPDLRHKAEDLRIMARVRYRQPLALAKLINLKSRRKVGTPTEALGLKTYKLIFEQPQKFVAPGQSAVFYLPAEAKGAKVGSEGGEMLGGGIIK